MPKRIAKKPSTFYNLGNNVFAYIKTRGGKVRVHLRTFTQNKSTLEWTPTKKGIILEREQFEKLLQCQKRLGIDYYLQSLRYSSTQNNGKQPQCQQPQ